MKKLSALGVVVAAGLLCSVPLTLNWSPAKTPLLSIDTADARLGRPLTPMSVAGVNRRVHRRAYITTMPGDVGITHTQRASLH